MSFLDRLLNLTRGEKLSRELDREMEFHIGERADELMAQGLGEADAWREARRRFGHRQRQKDNTRDADVLVWLESFVADVRYGVRTLRLSPGFTLIAVLSIALGVGANTAIFSLINALMLKPLPVPNADQLVSVERFVINNGQRDGGGSLTNPLWEQIRDHQDAVDAFAYGPEQFNLALGGEARRVDGSWVSGSYFPVLGVRPAAGRLLTPADDQRGCGALTVVSAGFASREYGSPDAAVGKRLTLNGKPFEIVGVTDPAFFGVDVGSTMQIYTPICSQPIVNGTDRNVLDARSMWWLQVMGRPRGTLTAAQVNARLAAASPGMNQATAPENWPAGPLRDYMRSAFDATPASTGSSFLRGTYKDALFALMVVVGVVLLIACTNVAHLLLARAAARQREMAVRMAIGAGRGRLVRQLLTESVLLSLLGATLGVFFASWASQLLVKLLSTRGNVVWLDLAVDARVLGFTIGVAMLTGILFGLAPAWRAARVAPHTAMQGTGRGATATRERFALTKGLVVGQVALSLVLLVAAGLLLRSFQKLVTLDPGFRRDGVLLARMNIENGGYGPDRRLGVFRDVLDQLRALPGVRSAAASLITPISGMGWNGRVLADGFTPKSERDDIVWFNGVSEDYFATLGTRQLAGRDLSRQDAKGGTEVAAINESMAHKLFGNQNPLGRTFQVENGAGRSGPVEVVAVVEDAKYRSLKETESATAYIPLAQSQLWGPQINYLVRVDGDAGAIIPSVRTTIGNYNHAISLEFVTLSSQVSASLTRPRLLATLSAFFGVLALLLATVGLYGTVAYSVARRHNEIGIRIALGAERGRVVRMVLGEVTRVLAAGTVLGVLIAVAATRLLSTFLFGLTPTDPVTLGLSVAALGGVALAAGALPAWRAARLDPMEALREE